MSRFWPHTAYAEDQPFHHAILWSHTLYRGFQTGATVGILTGAARAAFFSRPITVTSFWPYFNATILRHAGIGGVIGAGIITVGLPLRMRGREEIEWQDRSWRLLENKHQVEVDDFSLPGVVWGAAAASLIKPRGLPLTWHRVVGGAAVGSMAEVVMYMAWRYGIHNGRFD